MLGLCVILSAKLPSPKGVARLIYSFIPDSATFQVVSSAGTADPYLLFLLVLHILIIFSSTHQLI